MGQWGEYRFFFNYYHIQLLAAEFLICWHLPLRRRYRLPKAAAWLCYAGFPFLLQWLLNYDENLLETWYSLGFVAMMALSGVLLWFWFRFRSLKELAFYTMAACILQHLVYSTSQLACVTLGVSAEFPGQVLETVVLAGLLRAVLPDLRPPPGTGRRRGGAQRRAGGLLDGVGVCGLLFQFVGTPPGAGHRQFLFL